MYSFCLMMMEASLLIMTSVGHRPTRRLFHYTQEAPFVRVPARQAFFGRARRENRLAIPAPYDKMPA
jgi:hypothetical protein